MYTINSNLEELSSKDDAGGSSRSSRISNKYGLKTKKEELFSNLQKDTLSSNNIIKSPYQRQLSTNSKEKKINEKEEENENYFFNQNENYNENAVDPDEIFSDNNGKNFGSISSNTNIQNKSNLNRKRNRTSSDNNKSKVTQNNHSKSSSNLDRKDYIHRKIKNKIITIMQEKIKTQHIPNFKTSYTIFRNKDGNVDNYFFLHLTYFNILSLNLQLYELLNELFIEFKIKKEIQQKETKFSEKEIDEVRKLLISSNILLTNLQLSDRDILLDKLRHFFVDIGYKKNYEKKLYLKDKITVHNLLIQKGQIKPYIKQKNLNEIKNIPDFQLTLKEIIQNFYNSEDFPKFSENTAKNEQNFKMNKKYEHSLLVQEEDYNDYFKMIEKDCKLTDDQKSIVRIIAEFFKNKELNFQEIQNCRKYLYEMRK